MNAKLLLLAADMLDLAADEFGNHVCNDFDLPAEFTAADRAALAALMNRSNFDDSPSETWPADDVRSAEDLRRGTSDFAVMRGLAFGLREAARGAR